MLYFTKPLTLLPLILALTACGGGGGGSVSSDSSGSSSSTSTPTNWSAQAYVKAANAEASDFFGNNVAISGDTMVVGAMGEDSAQTTITNGSTVSSENSADGAGAAYVFVRSGSTWSQEAYLKAPNAGPGDFFGHSVAISGDTIVVGADGEDSNQTTITNGSTVNADDSASGTGAAYVFVRNTTSNTWSHQAYLKATNADTGDFFGMSVAISGDTLVVGAWVEDSAQTTITNGSTASSDNAAGGAGAAYVFVRNTSDNTWSQQAYLKATNAEAGDQFGLSVAINANTIVVGALNEDSNQTTIANGSTASANNAASSAGAAYVFVRSGSTWSQEAYLKASNAQPSDQFGSSVAVSGDTIVVGALNEGSNQTTITNGNTVTDNNSASAAGAAYVFVRNASDNTWSQQAYLKAPNAKAGYQFGGSVAISADTIVVGAADESSAQTTITNGSTASSDNAAGSAGAAYVYVRSDASWSHQAYLKTPNAEAGDRFASSVAVSGHTIVAGSRLEDSNQTTITNGSTAPTENSAENAGAAYVFTRN